MRSAHITIFIVVFTFCLYLYDNLVLKFYSFYLVAYLVNRRFIMEDIVDNDILISMVEERAVLWDKNNVMYKDRYATKIAWEQVCRRLYESYDSMSDREKREFGKAVTRRWTNLRDAYSKYLRKVKKNKELGLKVKKYVYDNQMKFLAKYYDSEQSADDFDTKVYVEVNDSNDEFLMLGETEKLEVSQERHSDTQNDTNETERSTQKLGKRKRKQQASQDKNKNKQDEIEMRLLKALEEKTDPHISFFQGVLPHLHKYDDSEVLEFQTGVLRLISTINAKKEATTKHFQPSSTNNFNSPSTPALKSSVKLPRPSPDPSESSEKSIDFDVL